MFHYAYYNLCVFVSCVCCVWEIVCQSNLIHSLFTAMRLFTILTEIRVCVCVFFPFKPDYCASGPSLINVEWQKLWSFRMWFLWIRMQFAWMHARTHTFMFQVVIEGIWPVRFVYQFLDGRHSIFFSHTLSPSFFFFIFIFKIGSYPSYLCLCCP